MSRPIGKLARSENTEEQNRTFSAQDAQARRSMRKGSERLLEAICRALVG